jgi:hypothetical protein
LAGVERDGESERVRESEGERERERDRAGKDTQSAVHYRDNAFGKASMPVYKICPKSRTMSNSNPISSFENHGRRNKIDYPEWL